MAKKKKKNRFSSERKDQTDSIFFKIPKDPQEDLKLLKEAGLLFEEEHLSHAFLLEGSPEKVSEVAGALIRRILLDFGGADAQNFSMGACPDLVLEREDKIPIDRVRELKSQVFRIPIESRYKVFYLEQAGSMLAPAQNALLKSLEEPPGYLVWILGTSNRSKLLPTIQSRCRIIPLERGEKKDLEIPSDPALLSLFEASLSGRGGEVFLKRDLLEEWKDQKEAFFSIFLSFLENLMKRKVYGEVWLKEADFPLFYKRSIEKMAGSLNLSQISRAIEETEKIRQLLAVNINFQFAVEGLALRLSRLT